MWDANYFHGIDKVSARNIIQLCIENNLGYDIVTERFYSGELKVINSVRTDVEIIGAMMSIVTHALTSNQMLSLNRKFDKEVGKRMIHENDLEKYATMMDGFLRAIDGRGGLYIKPLMED